MKGKEAQGLDLRPDLRQARHALLELEPALMREEGQAAREVRHERRPILVLLELCPKDRRHAHASLRIDRVRVPTTKHA